MKDTDPIVLVEDNEDDIVLTRRALSRNKIGNPLVIARDGAVDWVCLPDLHGSVSGSRSPRRSGGGASERPG